MKIYIDKKGIAHEETINFDKNNKRDMKIKKLFEKNIIKAKKFWAKYQKQSWWKYFKIISPTVNSFTSTLNPIKNGICEEIIPNGDDIRNMKFAVAKEIEQIIKDRTQECYLQCLAAECGEGKCADAIATKFPNDVSRYQGESNPLDPNSLLNKEIGETK